MQTKTGIKDLMALDVCFRTIAALLAMAIAGALLAALCKDITMPYLFGVKVHVFQYFILLAAFGFGPLGGAAVGAASCWITAMALGNPYIIVGNALLGFVAGFMYRKTNHIAISVVIAFICQVLWILLSDIFFMHMPIARVGIIILSLFIFDILWSVCAGLTYHAIRKHFKVNKSIQSD